MVLLQRGGGLLRAFLRALLRAILLLPLLPRPLALPG